MYHILCKVKHKIKKILTVHGINLIQIYYPDETLREPNIFVHFLQLFLTFRRKFTKTHQNLTTFYHFLTEFLTF